VITGFHVINLLRLLPNLQFVDLLRRPISCSGHSTGPWPSRGVFPIGRHGDYQHGSESSRSVYSCLDPSTALIYSVRGDLSTATTSVCRLVGNVCCSLSRRYIFGFIVGRFTFLGRVLPDVTRATM